MHFSVPTTQTYINIYICILPAHNPLAVRIRHKIFLKIFPSHRTSFATPVPHHGIYIYQH